MQRDFQFRIYFLDVPGDLPCVAGRAVRADEERDHFRAWNGARRMASVRNGCIKCSTVPHFSRIIQAMNSPVAAPAEKRFDWPLCYDAEQLVLARIESFLACNRSAATLAKRMLDDTGP